jgi:hypothetical protein
MNRLLLVVLALLSWELYGQQQDPLREIDPFYKKPDLNGRQNLPRYEIPGTIRRTQEDTRIQPFGRSGEEQTARMPPDTAFIYVLDKNGKRIDGPLPTTESGTGAGSSEARPQRTAADSLNHIPGAEGDTTKGSRRQSEQ